MMGDVLIKVAQGETLNKQQAAFNKLVEQIQKRQAEVEKIQNNIKLFEEAKASIIGDLPTKENEARVAFATQLDGLYENKGFTKREKQKLAHFILNITRPGQGAMVSEDRRKLFEKYTQLAYGSFSGEVMDENREMFEAILQSMGLDIDLSKVERLNLTELERLVQEHIAKEQRQEMEDRKEEENFQRKNKYSSDLSGKAKETAEKLNKSWKQIYLSLVKVLHPDTVTDEAEKMGKEAALKEVTVAYDTNNFYRLLQLQLQYGGIDSLLNDAKPEVIAQFTAILKSQSQDLNQTLVQMKDSLKHEGLGFLFKKDAEEKAKDFLYNEKRATEAIIEGIKHETMMYSDVSSIKKILKKVSLDEFASDF